MQTLLAYLTNPTLTALVFFPAVACLPLLLFREADSEGAKRYALGASLAELGLGGYVVFRHLGEGGVTLPTRESLAWIPSLGIQYEVAMDGISLPLVALTLLLLPLVVLGSWRSIDQHWPGYATCLLLLTTGILGALLAMDLFLFYVFWELMLVPMYLLIGIWGGRRRVYAAVKFFLFTMAGSLPMLLGVIWMGHSHRVVTGEWSFLLADLSGIGLPMEQQTWLFLAFGLAFAIKVPVVPFHIWLPDAHVEAPTGGSVFLAGILLKLGTYGFLRYAVSLFPHAAQAYTVPVVTLAVIGILYGALVAWAQTDMKKLVAYSSVAHLGFVMLGLFAFDLLAWQGALLQMVNHGLSTGALFFLVGMLYERRHTRKLDHFGGLAKVMPWFAFFLVFSSLASMGLPGLNGFVGELLILIGTYRSSLADLQWAAILATFGVVLAAVYLLKLLYRTLWGPLAEENRQLSDLSLREILVLTPLAGLMLLIGVAPNLFLRPSERALRYAQDYYQYRVSLTPEDEPAPIPPRSGSITIRDGKIVATEGPL